MDPPILGLLEFFNNEVVGIGVGLDVGKEPGRKGLGNVIIVDTRGGIQVLDEDGVVGASGCAHDSALVDVFDVTGLHGESVHDDGEVGYLPAILLKSFGALNGVSILIGMEATLKVLDCGSTARSDCFKVSSVLGFLRFESFRKSTIPSCLGRQ